VFRVIILLMIGVPALEIFGLIKAASLIGGWQTFFAVILTGVVGAYLAKQEGLKTWAQAQSELAQGRIPGKSLMDGISIFAGGLLLLTPGFFTDALGFLLILPISRTIIQAYLRRWLDKKLKSGEIHFYYRR